MAKPPKMHLEDARSYERRLLQNGWYDDRPSDQRERAERVARGDDKSRPQRSALPTWREIDTAAWLKNPTAFWLHPEGPLSDTTPEEWLAKQKASEETDCAVSTSTRQYIGFRFSA